MKISFNWLKQYVKLPDSITPEEVAEKLKLSTVEVEGVTKQGENLGNIVVGKIIAVEKHPNADKLAVCQVDLGSEQTTIVCGGSNVATGMLVAVAKTGAKVKWHGEGDLIELKPATIRGVESNGMICGADEIGLGEMFPKKDEKEIVDLGKSPLEGGEGDVGARGHKHLPPRASSAPSSRRELRPGTSLAEALHLNDAILEIDNKSLSNRPDLWGHYGIAREVAALFNRHVEAYKTNVIKEQRAKNKEQTVRIEVKVEEPKLCQKYIAVAMSGITVGESPAWLKEKLNAVGLRPINNIVDITNFVMLDLGQPMHAFDVEHLKLKDQNEKVKIIVRRAADGEEFVTLDEQKRTLDNSMLVIANGPPAGGGEAVALAGVMGGKKSGISKDTMTIVFESANFDASTVRKTSTKLGLRTDSSARFEKSLDPNLAPVALARAVELVLECCPQAKVSSAVVSVGEPRLFTGPLEIPFTFFAQKIGVVIPDKTIVAILERLGFRVKQKKGVLFVTIPTWRATKDVSIPEDIVEEVLRVYGYDNIPSSLPTFPITPPEANKLRNIERTVADMLAKELGYNEVYNYSFVSAEQIKRFNDDSARHLELDNPISKEKPFLRCNLPYNLLENIVANNNYAENLRLFEIGKVFHADKPGQRASTNSDELLPRQDTWVTAIYRGKKDGVPFNEVRRVAERAREVLGFPLAVAPDATSALHQWQHPSRSAEMMVGQTFIGRLYEFHPKILASFGIEDRVAVCSLNLSTLSEFAAQKIKYEPLSLYPEVVRDIAFTVAKDISHAQITQELGKADPLLKKSELFDVYEGSKVGEGKKSVAYHLTYARSDRTLTTEEVDAAEQKIKKELTKKFTAEIRL